MKLRYWAVQHRGRERWADLSRSTVQLECHLQCPMLEDKQTSISSGW